MFSFRAVALAKANHPHRLAVGRASDQTLLSHSLLQQVCPCSFLGWDSGWDMDQAWVGFYGNTQEQSNSLARVYNAMS
jgi:hypothetical protein